MTFNKSDILNCQGFVGTVCSGEEGSSHQCLAALQYMEPSWNRLVLSSVLGQAHTLSMKQELSSVPPQSDSNPVAKSLLIQPQNTPEQTGHLPAQPLVLSGQES